MGNRSSRNQRLSQTTPPTTVTFPVAPLPPLSHPNALHTNKYSFKNPGRWNFFLWKATAGQFKRLGNVYFLTIGFIMFIGYYTE